MYPAPLFQQSLSKIGWPSADALGAVGTYP